MDKANGFDRQRAELAALLSPPASPPAAVQPLRIATNGSGVRQPTIAAKAADPSDPFQRLYALGYRSLIPIVPVGANLSPRSSLALRIGRAGAKDPRGKAPGIWTPTGWTGLKDWTTRGDSTPSDLVAWHECGADVGLRMGADLYGLDYDTLSAAIAEKCWEVTCRIIPGVHAKRIGRAPKFAILLRVTTPVPYKMVEFIGKDGETERVEGLGAGKQLKMWGLHPTTGLPYTYEPETPARRDLVEATREQIDELFETLREMLPAATNVLTEGEGKDRCIDALRGDADMIEAVVRRLPNTTKHFPTRESYRDVGYAIKGAIANERRAFDCFAEWSDRWQDDPEGVGNVDGYPEAIWRTLHPRKIGASWLLEKFEKVTGVSQAEMWFAALPTPTTSIWDAAPADPSPASGRKPFELVDFHDLANLALLSVGSPLVDGLIECGSFVMLYGPSGAGKTFVSLDIAFHVAMGMAWNGKRVARRRVVYLALEGAAGARKRSDALRRRYGIREEESRGWFFYRAANVDLFHAEADLAAAIDAISAVPEVGLVVVDTTSRALSGADENSSVDMGVYVANMDRIRAATSACVLNVHHTGKDIARGARGHSLLRAATDTEIEIVDGELTVTKQREIETELRIGFLLEPVSLGRHQDGRDITSCVVRWDQAQTPGSERESRVTEKEGLVLAALKKAHARNSEQRVKLDHIVDEVANLGVKMKKDTVRKHIESLAQKSQAISVSRGWWVPKSGISGLSRSDESKSTNAFSVGEIGKQSEEGIFS